MKTKIAAFGEKDIMLIFKAAGADIFPVLEIEQAAVQLKKIAREDYAIIFITDTVAVKLDNVIKEFADKPLPSIVVVPGLGERNNYAVESLRKSIIKAIGTDVFSK